MSTPAAYEDFEAGIKHTISTDPAAIGHRRASSTAFIDNLLPNVKYYYIFRAYDSHNHVSYPSEVYEVELVEDEGAVFPSVRVVPLRGDEKPTEKTKKLRRFLQIKPQLSQVVVNSADPAAADWPEGSAPNGGSLPMGIDNESIWGKKFKIRLTSRKSGKKIDLNVSFAKQFDPARPGTSSDD